MAHSDDRPRTLVIVNPAAGGGAAARAEPRVASYLRRREVPADFVRSRSGDDVRRLAAEAASRGYTRVAVLGGDGTFHQAVSAALSEGVAGHLEFAFLPAGNGNDIARGFGIPEDALEAARLLGVSPPKGTTHRFDALRVQAAKGGERYYFGAGGMGLDAEAAQLVNRRFRGWPGTLRYIAAAFAAYRSFQPVELEAAFDAVKWQGRVLLAAVANVPCYGAGIGIAPAAVPDDGWLDVTLVEPLPLGRLVEALPGIVRREARHPDWPEITHHRARRVSLAVAKNASSSSRTPRAALFHGDGELLGESPLEVEVAPAAVRVVTPEKIR